MADAKISALAAAVPLDGTELIPIVQGGVNVKLPASKIIQAIGADQFALRRTDVDAINVARKFTGKCLAEYADTSQFTLDFSAVPALVKGQTWAVSGNRITSGGSTSGNSFYIPLPRNVTPGEKFHFSSVLDNQSWPNGYAHFGFDMSPYTDTGLSNNTYVLMGLGGGGTTSRQTLVGSAVSSIGILSDSATGALPAGQMQFSIDGDEDTVSICFRSVADATKTWCYAIPVSVLAATGKPIGRLIMALGDSRTTAGHAWRPIVGWIGSQQPTRTKIVINGLVSEQAGHRDVFKIATVSPNPNNSGGNDYWRYSIPANYDPRVPAPLAIYLHPANSSLATADRAWIGPNIGPMTKALSDAGYLVVGCQDGFVQGSPNTDRYGNDASILNFTEAYKFMRSHFSIGEVVLYGESMGGTTAINLLSRRTIPNIAAVYLQSPGVDLYGGLTANGGSFATPIRTAYNIASDDSDFLVKTAGHDPQLIPGEALRGVPMRFCVVTDDTIATPSTNDAILNKVLPFAPEASKKITATGGHLAAASFSPSDMMAFLNKYVA